LQPVVSDNFSRKLVMGDADLISEHSASAEMNARPGSRAGGRTVPAGDRG